MTTDNNPDQMTEADEREAYRMLVRTGCSIPLHLMKYQRDHDRSMRDFFRSLGRAALRLADPTP